MTDISTDYSDKKVIILLEDVDRLALHALNYAKEMSKDITVFSGVSRQEREEELLAKWAKAGMDLPYIIKYSQYKSAGTLLSEYIDSAAFDKDVVVLVPLVVIKSLWQRYLNRSYLKHLKRSFIDKNNVVFLNVPYYLDQAA